MDDGVDADEDGVEPDDKQEGEACMCLWPAQAEKGDDDDDAVLLPPYPLCCLGSWRLGIARGDDMIATKDLYSRSIWCCKIKLIRRIR